MPHITPPPSSGGSSAHVYEVTNLLIPSGTDWSGDGVNIVSTMAQLAGQVFAYSLAIELAAAPAVADTLYFAATFGSLTGGSNSITLDSVSGGGLQVLGGVGSFSAPVSVSFETSGVTTAPITIVHARAAFLVI